MGTHISDVAVTASPVIENLDVVEHVRPCLLARSIDSPSYPLFLQTAEKRFRHNVVKTVAPATHTRDQTVVLAKPHPVNNAVEGGALNLFCEED